MMTDKGAADAGTTLSNDSNTATDGQPASLSIRMVVQRYRRASILLEESHVVTVGEPLEESLSRSVESLLLSPSGTGQKAAASSEAPPCLGMLVFISFSKTATPELVEQAAKTILNLPTQTVGAWGDGSGTKSMFQLLTARHRHSKDKEQLKTRSPVSIILVPQANLIAKVKKNGKSVQYHDQIEKSQGEKLYNLFCHEVESLLLDHQESLGRGGSTHKTSNKPTTPDPGIPPIDLFCSNPKYAAEYGSFDETSGIPLTTASGEPLAKSARKKLQKIYDAHVKRHEKWLIIQERQQQQQWPDSVTNVDTTRPASTREDGTPSLDDSFVCLIKGTFGKRQGLEIFSDMGPFCHVIEL
jgi:hypothetical protein